MTKIKLDYHEEVKLNRFLESGKSLVDFLPDYIINLCGRIEETSDFEIDRNLLIKRIEYYIENEQEYYANNVLLFIQDLNFDKLKIGFGSLNIENRDFQNAIENVIFDECKVSKGARNAKKINNFLTLFEKDSKLISYNIIENVIFGECIENKFVELMISDIFKERIAIYGIILSDNVVNMSLNSIEDITLIGYVSRELILNIKGKLV